MKKIRKIADGKTIFKREENSLWGGGNYVAAEKDILCATYMRKAREHERF